jgi:hypothetical protein
MLTSFPALVVIAVVGASLQWLIPELDIDPIPLSLNRKLRILSS